MLSLSVVTVVAYITATLMGSRPIYESLLDRFMEKHWACGRHGRRCEAEDT